MPSPPASVSRPMTSHSRSAKGDGLEDTEEDRYSFNSQILSYQQQQQPPSTALPKLERSLIIRPKSVSTEMTSPPELLVQSPQSKRFLASNNYCAKLIRKVSKSTGYNGRLAEALSGKELKSRKKAAVHDGVDTSKLYTEVDLYHSLSEFRNKLKRPDWKVAAQPGLAEIPVFNAPGLSANLLKSPVHSHHFPSILEHSNSSSPLSVKSPGGHHRSDFADMLISNVETVADGNGSNPRAPPLFRSFSFLQDKKQNGSLIDVGVVAVQDQDQDQDEDEGTKQALEEDKDDQPMKNFKKRENGKRELFKIFREATDVFDQDEFNHLQKDHGSGRHSYLKECNQRKLAPKAFLFGRPDVKNVNLSNFRLTVEETKALSEAMKCYGEIEKFDFQDNRVGMKGISFILLGLKQHKNLKELNFQNTGLSDSTLELSNFLKQSSQLTCLNISNNTFKPDALASLLKEVSTNSTITKLCMSRTCPVSWNSSSLGAAISQILSGHNAIQELDLSWNCIRGSGALTFAECLGLNKTLTYLDLSNNGFGDTLPLDALLLSLQDPRCRLKSLNLSYNRIGKEAGVILASAIESASCLDELKLNGNLFGQMAARMILNAFSMSSKPRRLALNCCSAGLRSSTDLDMINPGGDFVFDLSQPHNRALVRILVVLTAQEKGSIVKGSLQINGKPCRLPVRLDCSPSDIPSKGILSLQFCNKRYPPCQQDVLDPKQMRLIESVLAEALPQEQEALLELIASGDTVFSIENVQTILRHVLQINRVVFISRCLFRITPFKEGMQMLFNSLDSPEQKKLKTKASEAAWRYHDSNPSGAYRLNLGNAVDRLVAIRLYEQRNKMMVVGPLPPFASKHECVMLNFHVDGQYFESIPATFFWPDRGFVEVDFVAISKPGDDTMPLDDDEWAQALNRFVRLEKGRHFQALHDYTNDYYFTSAQGVSFAKECLKISPELAIEAVVRLFSRIIDYHGFQQILKVLNPQLREVVVGRMGIHNLFDVVTAIGFQEFDLSMASSRFIVAEYIQLAVKEPGVNVIHCYFEGKPFEIPSSWERELPPAGQLSFFYCRSAAVVKKICSKCPPRSLPPNYASLQPSGTAWVEEVKKENIRKLLQSVFKSAEQAFNKMDTDGSGQMSRVEFARGIRDCGVTLQPFETEQLMDMIDNDKTGQIDLEEFKKFWEGFIGKSGTDLPGISI